VARDTSVGHELYYSTVKFF